MAAPARGEVGGIGLHTMSAQHALVYLALEQSKPVRKNKKIRWRSLASSLLSAEFLGRILLY
jgi:hypothetical protein